MVFAGIIVGAIGLVILVAGAVTGMRLRRFLSAAVATIGKVVGFEEQVSTDSDGDATSSTHAVVEYSTSAGATVTFVERSQTLGGLAVGSEVPVKYDPASPEKARIASNGRLWLSTIVLAVIGLVMVIVGVVLLVAGG